MAAASAAEPPPAPECKRTELAGPGYAYPAQAVLQAEFAGRSRNHAAQASPLDKSDDSDRNICAKQGMVIE